MNAFIYLSIIINKFPEVYLSSLVSEIKFMIALNTVHSWNFLMADVHRERYAEHKIERWPHRRKAGRQTVEIISRAHHRGPYIVSSIS